MTSQADRTATLVLELNQARAKLAAIREAAQGCENNWTPAGQQPINDCARDGRDPDSPYGATGYCWPCKLRHILNNTHTRQDQSAELVSPQDQPASVVWSGAPQRGMVPGLGGFHV